MQLADGLLELDRVCKNYDQGSGTLAVDQLTLRTEPGSFLAILGPSGCGKSTTLRMVAGLEEVTGGDIRIDGRSMVGVHPKDRHIGLAFETYSLYPPLTVFENIAYNLRAKQTPSQEITKRVYEVAERLQITDLLEEKPSRLSGGQKQRVNIARAIVRQPHVLLLDEPLSHLDAYQRKQMRGEIQRLQHELKITTIIVTHDQQEAMALASHIAIMNLGVLQQYGTVQEIYDSPSNLFAASFIGEPPMNVLSGTASIRGGVLDIVTQGGIHRRIPTQLADRSSFPCTLGVRPQDIRVLIGEEDSITAGRVVNREFLGEEMQWWVQVGSETISLWSSVQHSVLSGELVSLVFERWHVFDDASGDRLHTEVIHQLS